MADDQRRVNKEIRLKPGEFVLLDVMEDGRAIRVRVVASRATARPADRESPAPRKTTPSARAARAKKAPAKGATGRNAKAPAKRATGTNVKPAPRSVARNVAPKKAVRKRG